jgi:hypothetical protein
LGRVKNDAFERRRRGRVPVRLAVTVRLDGEEITVESRDLSLKGLACLPDPRLQQNQCCQVVIRLTPDIQAVIKGRVVRAGETGAAIDFLATDPESFYHLKKIVEYHSRCPEAVAQELLTPAFPLSRPRNLFAPRRGRK